MPSCCRRARAQSSTIQTRHRTSENSWHFLTVCVLWSPRGTPCDPRSFGQTTQRHPTDPKRLRRSRTRTTFKTRMTYAANGGDVVLAFGGYLRANLASRRHIEMLYCAFQALLRRLVC